MKNHHSTFKCSKYKEDFNPEMILELKEIVGQASAKEKNETIRKELGEIGDFLDPKSIHDFEGRSKYLTKESFSKSEMINATKLYKKDVIKYLLYRYRFNTYPASQKLSDFPVVLSIEPTNICNLRCVMCYQADDSFWFDKNKGFMDFNLFKKIIDEGVENGLCSIVLASRGEPLLHPQIIKMIKYAKEAGILEIKINTNVTRLTEDISRGLLEAPVDLLVYSVDACKKGDYERIRPNANFDEVINNIKKFNEIRAKEFPNSPTRTRISTVIVDERQNAEEIKTFWEPLVDEFGCKWASDRLKIYESARKESDEPCSRFWERVYIWWDGTVNPCDVDYKSNLILGKISDKVSIKDIWQGPIIQKYREMHKRGLKNELDPCKHCAGY